MLKYCKDKWAENEDKLREAISKTDRNIRREWTYADLVILVVENILNPGMQPKYLRHKGFLTSAGSPWQTNVGEVDDGDYQGTLIFVIHMNSYQPNSDEYMFTYVEYGSCSGCDTLQGIQSEDIYDEENQKEIDGSVMYDYMTLCKHLVDNFKHPFESNFVNFEEAKA